MTAPIPGPAESGAARADGVAAAAQGVPPPVGGSDGESVGADVFDPAFAVFPLTRAQLDEWAKLYGKGARQIRRWIEEAATTNDPCPINDPVRLVEWWPRHKVWRVPDSLLKAASVAKAERLARAPSEPVVSASPLPARAAPLPPPIAAPGATSIVLAEYQLLEGEVVQQQRRLVAAVYAQLERAYLNSAGDTDLLQGKYTKAAEALRKLEKDDREDQKTRGSLIPRASVQRDLDTAAELFRQMTETETRRVLELCPSLGLVQRSEVSTAISAVAQARNRILRNLKSLKTSADALLELAAA